MECRRGAGWGYEETLGQLGVLGDLGTTQVEVIGWKEEGRR